MVKDLLISFDFLRPKHAFPNSLGSVLFEIVFCSFSVCGLSLWLIGTVRAEPETVISRAWVQSPDPAE